MGHPNEEVLADLKTLCILKTAIIIIIIIIKICSSCDSRNLNMSPFCNTSLTSLAMWQPSVQETYGNQKTEYVNEKRGPMRQKYPNSMGEREVVSSLTKVRLSEHCSP